MNRTAEETSDGLQPQPAPEPRHVCSLLLLGFVLLFGSLAHGYLENTDAQITLHAARGYVERGTFGLRDDAQSTAAERLIVHLVRNEGRFGMVGQDGAVYVWFPIGHCLLLVPCVLLGKRLDAAMPAARDALLAQKGPIFGGMFGARFVASLMTALFAAGSAFVLYLLARALAASPRDALRATLAAVLCTQFLPGTALTTSDGPGMFFLLLHVLMVVHAVATHRTVLRFAVLAGLAGGAAVLLRYPNALPVVVCSLWLVVSTARTGRLAPVLALVLGGLPALVLLCGTNFARYGSLFETGYSAGANAGWWDYPVLYGVPLILLAPGKGILWFNPPLWLALSSFRKRHLRSGVVLVASGILLGLLLLVGHTAGWAAGQCYGIRYFTSAIVLLVLVMFAIERPWLRSPRLYRVVVVLGFVFALGGVVTPYRGHMELAIPAAAVLYPEASPGEHPELANFDPRLSPLHSHFTYAWLSMTGRLEQGGAANTTGPMFGVDVPGPIRPSHPEDLRFRHVWPTYLGYLLGLPLWPLLPLLWLSAAACLRASWRRMPLQ